MFGGLEYTPNKSPHLRKSGSRPVVFDIDSSELGNSSEEDLLLSKESNEMKGGTTALSSMANVPSPLLLLRFKMMNDYSRTDLALLHCNAVIKSGYGGLFRWLALPYVSGILFWCLWIVLYGTVIQLNKTLMFELKLFSFVFFLISLPSLFTFVYSFVWGLCCFKIEWDSVMRMSADLRDLFLYEAFLYYNPLLLVTMMVWLWGINLWVFAQSNIGYGKIFDLDQSHLTHREIWKCATWMTIIVPTSMTAYLYLYSHGEVPLAASQPVLLYAAVVMTLIFPFDIFCLSSRFFFLRTAWRIVFPLQAITFADFFLADIFTSMSKVFSDLERSVCRMVHRQVATIAWFEADSVCGSHSVAIPIVLGLPYIFRFFQCLRQYKDTRENTSLLNALKYSTAVPVIFLSALKYHVSPEKWTNIYRPLWLLSSVLNSLYSFYWDITRDWDLSCFTRIFKFSKPHMVSDMLHGQKWVTIWVIGSNLILRCTWTYKLSAHLRHNYLTVFAISALEMLRRFQWVFFRVENEFNKMNNSKSATHLSMTDLPTEEHNLLDSDARTV